MCYQTCIKPTGLEQSHGRQRLFNLAESILPPGLVKLWFDSSDAHKAKPLNAQCCGASRVRRRVHLAEREDQGMRFRGVGTRGQVFKTGLRTAVCGLRPKRLLCSCAASRAKSQTPRVPFCFMSLQLGPSGMPHPTLSERTVVVTPAARYKSTLNPRSYQFSSVSARKRNPCPKHLKPTAENPARLPSAKASAASKTSPATLGLGFRLPDFVAFAARCDR